MPVDVFDLILSELKAVKASVDSVNGKVDNLSLGLEGRMTVLEAHDHDVYGNGQPGRLKDAEEGIIKLEKVNSTVGGRNSFKKAMVAVVMSCVLAIAAMGVTIWSTREATAQTMALQVSLDTANTEREALRTKLGTLQTDVIDVRGDVAGVSGQVSIGENQRIKILEGMIANYNKIHATDGHVLGVRDQVNTISDDLNRLKATPKKTKKILGVIPIG